MENITVSLKISNLVLRSGGRLIPLRQHLFDGPLRGFRGIVQVAETANDALDGGFVEFQSFGHEDPLVSQVDRQLVEIFDS